MANKASHDEGQWERHDWSKQQRKQKRSRDKELLKPKGSVYHKKEEPYRRKKNIMPKNIPVADIRPQIDVIETNPENGESTVVFSRDFQESPLMKEEQIKPAEPVTPIVEAVIPASTDWDETLVNLTDKAREAAAEPGIKEMVKPIVKETLADNKVEQVTQSTTKPRGRFGRAMLYAALTSAVVVGGVLTYLHLNKDN